MSELTHDHINNKNIIVDSDVHFTIDTTTRIISNRNGDKANEKLILTQYDNNSERYSFDIDRIVDGHDLFNCDKVQINYVNISPNKNANPNIGIYLVDDVHQHETNPNKITFSWLVSRNATLLDGVLNFLVSFECTNGDKVLYRWSTTTFEGIRINVGMDNDNAVMEQYIDKLLVWQKNVEKEIIPVLVEECYIDREFATSEEVANIFDMRPSTDESLISIDQYPTDNSKNLVTSGGVKKYTDDTVASALTESKEYTDTHGGKIDSISVNGVKQTIDENKNVDLIIEAAVEVPTKTSDLTNDSGFITSDNLPKKTSDLTNDGDGDSPFASEDYVNQNGGKIDNISVNGVTQTIDENKNVNINIPTYDDTEIKQNITTLQNTKADKTEIPDVSGYVTHEYVEPYFSNANANTIANPIGGFKGGASASPNSGGYDVSRGGAIGNKAAALNGGSAGNQAFTSGGGAIGDNAKSGKGFAGGEGANAGTTSMDDRIQLGTGTNTKDKTLQIYDDNIYDADTHTLTVKNIELDGEDIKDKIGAGGSTIIWEVWE